MTLLIRFSLLLAFIVVALGAYTRLTDAGLGCPDWPSCYGQLTVPQTDEIAEAQLKFPDHPIEPEKAWNEMIHRYIAGLLGICIGVLFVWGVLVRRALRFRRHLALLFIVVVFQALLGMWTVTLSLMPIIVLAHLLGGFATTSLLFLLFLRDTQYQVCVRANAVSYLKVLAVISFIVLLMQISLGAWTSANYAALVCSEFPFCQGDWQGDFSFYPAFSPIQAEALSYEYGILDHSARTSIHVSHRIGALVTSILLTCFFFLQFICAYKGVLKAVSALGFLLLCIQVSLGISNVVFHLPIYIAVLHNLVALLLLCCLIYSIYSLLRRSTGLCYA